MPTVHRSLQQPNFRIQDLECLDVQGAWVYSPDSSLLSDVSSRVGGWEKNVLELQ